MSNTIIVIKSEDRELATNWITETIDPVGGADTFSQALYTGTNPEPSHYWCGINLTPDQLSDVSFFISPLIFDCRPDQVLTALGLNRGEFLEEPPVVQESVPDNTAVDVPLPTIEVASLGAPS